MYEARQNKSHIYRTLSSNDKSKTQYYKLYNNHVAIQRHICIKKSQDEKRIVDKECLDAWLMIVNYVDDTNIGNLWCQDLIEREYYWYNGQFDLIKALNSEKDEYLKYIIYDQKSFVQNGDWDGTDKDVFFFFQHPREDDEKHLISYHENKISIKPFSHFAYSDQFSGCLMAVFTSDINWEPMTIGEKYCAHIALNKAHIFEHVCNLGYLKNVHFFKPVDRTLEGGIDRNKRNIKAVGKIETNNNAYASYRLTSNSRSVQGQAREDYEGEFEPAKLYEYKTLILANADNLRQMDQAAVERLKDYFIQKCNIYGITWLIGDSDGTERYDFIRKEQFNNLRTFAIRCGLIQSLPGETRGKYEQYFINNNSTLSENIRKIFF